MALLTDEQKREFNERGFLKVGKVVDDATVEALRKRVYAVMEGRGQYKPEALRDFGLGADKVVVQIVNIWMADDLFNAHMYHPTVAGMAAELMGTDTVRVWHDQVQYKPPRMGGPTDWHQDHPYWPIIQPADLISAWMAIEDADVENGCMWMVPGSHKWGPHKGGTIGTDPDGFTPQPDLSQLPEGADPTPVPCPVKAGEVMFHHCLTWHGSPPNRSERGRPAIAVHYMPAWTRYEPKGGHLVEHRVEVKPGEVLQGTYFPTVWQNGPLAPGPLPHPEESLTPTADTH